MPTRAPGDRILDLSFQGTPLDPARRLKVAVNSYREYGGGGFPAIATAPRLGGPELTVRELISKMLLTHPSLEAPSLPGWRLRPAYAATPERPLVDRLVRQGVLTADVAATIDSRKLASLIFRPGFTTAGEGVRGIGMDVVRDLVNKAGGRVGIATKPGEYTRFRISLPHEKSASGAAVA